MLLFQNAVNLSKQSPLHAAIESGQKMVKQFFYFCHNFFWLIGYHYFIHTWVIPFFTNVFIRIIKTVELNWSKFLQFVRLNLKQEIYVIKISQESTRNKFYFLK